MKKKLKHLWKKVSNLNDNNKQDLFILGLSIIVLIISYFIIGLSKTITLAIILGILLLSYRYGGVIIKKLKHLKKKRNIIEKINNINDKREKKKRHKILNILIYSFTGIFLLGVIVAVAFSIYIIKSAPNFDPNNLYRRETSIVYDSKGLVIAKLAYEKRVKVSYNSLPQVFIDAVIATEDSRFMQHNGFDLPRFMKASFGQLLGNSGAGGASTISMQVVKNNFTSTKQTITRKFTDIYLAIFKLEKKYTKEQIFEYYVNTPYLGNSSYGVEQASQSYFGKSIKDVNLAEASLIAGLFQAPAAYNPYLYPEKASKRRDTVLYLMKLHGYITEEERALAASIPVTSLIKDINTEVAVNPYQGYIDTVIDEVKEKTGTDPYNTSMKIYTALNTEKQDYLNRIYSGELFTWKDDMVQAGVVMTDVNTGAVIAIGSGRNQVGERVFNFATMLKRQPGSTAKPFYDYGPGFEYLNWGTTKPFLDDVHGYTNGPNVRNYDNKYKGIISLRYALTDSRNIPALKAFQANENAKILEFVEGFGLSPEVSNGYIHEAHSIGGYNGESPLTLAAAYGTFANGGYYIEPYTITKIEFTEDNRIVEYRPKKTQAVSAETAFLITDTLVWGVNNNFVAAGQLPGFQIAAKTGTTNYSLDVIKRYGLPSNAVNDFWAAAYTPEYSVAMWYGYSKIDAKYVLRFSESTTRKKLFNTIIKGLITNKVSFTRPSTIVEVAVEKETDPVMLPSANTPSDMIETSLYKKGTEPTEVSPRYNNLPDVKDISATSEANNNVISWSSISLPNQLSEVWFKETFKDLYGKQINKYWDNRLAYNNNYMGQLGYDVYIKNSDNSLNYLGFTTANTYIHKTNKYKTTYVVKTSYALFKSASSPGVSITVDNDNNAVQINLSGKEEIEINKGTPYIDYNPPVVVTYKGDEIQSGITITTTYLNKANGSVIQGINTNQTGLFAIEYKVTYKDTTVELERLIRVK